MITDNAINTLLYALGLERRIRENIFDRWSNYSQYSYNRTEKYKEICEHEIQFFFPKIYKDKRYVSTK